MLHEKVEIGLYEYQWNILVAMLPSKEEAERGDDLLRAKIKWEISNRLHEAKSIERHLQRKRELLRAGISEDQVDAVLRALHKAGWDLVKVGFFDEDERGE